MNLPRHALQELSVRFRDIDAVCPLSQNGILPCHSVFQYPQLGPGICVLEFAIFGVLSSIQSRKGNTESPFPRRILTSAELDTKLSGRLIWRLGVDYSYENLPAAGRQANDTLVSSSIAVRF